MSTQVQQAADRLEKDTVAFTVEGGIAWVSFNRPEKRNCMSPKLNRRMKQVIRPLPTPKMACRFCPARPWIGGCARPEWSH